MLQPLFRTLRSLRLALPLALLLALAAPAARAQVVISQPDQTFGLGLLKSAIYTRDGSGIYAGNDSGVISLLDAQTGKVLRTFLGHKGPVNCFALTPDGKRLLSGGSDKTARLWDTASGALLQTFQAPESGGIGSVALTPDAQRIATATMVGNIRLWKSPSQSTRLYVWPGARAVSYVYCAVAFSHDGRTLAGAPGDNNVRLWDVASGALQRTLYDHRAEVASVAFSPDDKQLISGSNDRTVISWSLASGAIVGYYTGHAGAVYSAVFSPDGQSVLTTSKDGSVRLWNASTCQVTRTFTLPAAAISAEFSADGKKIIAPSPGKNQIHQWNAATGAPIPTLFSYAGPIRAAAVSPDGRLLVTGHTENVTRVWDLTANELKLAVSTAQISAVAFTPDGSQFIVASQQKGYQYSAQTGALLGSFFFATGYFPPVAISHDGKRILFGKDCFDFSTRKLLYSITDTQPSALCFMPGSYDFIAGQPNGDIRLLKGDTGASLRTFTGQVIRITSVQVFPGGERLLSGCTDGSARIWNMSNGFPIRTLPIGSMVNAAAIAPDGRQFLTACLDLRVWDSASGELITRFLHPGSGFQVYAAGFLPDGRLFSASEDGRLRLWRQPRSSAPDWSRYQ